MYDVPKQTQEASSANWDPVTFGARRNTGRAAAPALKSTICDVAIVMEPLEGRRTVRPWSNLAVP